jgi:hypothetical protein
MNAISATYHILIRGIAFVYLLLFMLAFVCSGYFLLDIVQLKPIPLIGLLKYLLLSVLFLILSRNAIKAFTLLPQHIGRFYRSTTNFKWLFLIAVIISVLAKLGLFDTALHRQVAVTNLQIGILLSLGIFCFRSDALLAKVQSVPDLEQDEIEERLEG